MSSTRLGRRGSALDRQLESLGGARSGEGLYKKIEIGRAVLTGEVTRRLGVAVLEARGLPEGSDPYCEFTVVRTTEAFAPHDEGEAARTETIDECSTPVFNSGFVFGLKRGFDEHNVDELALCVMLKSEALGKERDRDAPLGIARVSLMDIDIKSTQIYDEWYALERCGRMPPHSASGEVRVKFRFLDSASELGLLLDDNDNEAVAEAKRREKAAEEARAKERADAFSVQNAVHKGADEGSAAVQRVRRASDLSSSVIRGSVGRSTTHLTTARRGRRFSMSGRPLENPYAAEALGAPTSDGENAPLRHLESTFNQSVIVLADKFTRFEEILSKNSHRASTPKALEFLQSVVFSLGRVNQNVVNASHVLDRNVKPATEAVLTDDNVTLRHSAKFYLSMLPEKWARLMRLIRQARKTGLAAQFFASSPSLGPEVFLEIDDQFTECANILDECAQFLSESGFSSSVNVVMKAMRWKRRGLGKGKKKTTAAATVAVVGGGGGGGDDTFAARMRMKQEKKEMERKHREENIGPGERILARYHGRKRYFKGSVVAKNEDGTFAVKYDDGFHELKVRRQLIKLAD